MAGRTENGEEGLDSTNLAATLGSRATRVFGAEASQGRSKQGISLRPPAGCRAGRAVRTPASWGGPAREERRGEGRLGAGPRCGNRRCKGVDSGAGRWASSSLKHQVNAGGARRGKARARARSHQEEGTKQGSDGAGTWRTTLERQHHGGRPATQVRHKKVAQGRQQRCSVRS